MSDLHIKEILYESVTLELLVSDLYLLYSTAYAEDKGFWWQMALEEKNHAALLKSTENFIDAGVFPEDALRTSVESLINANSHISGLIKAFRNTPPARDEAYRNALLLEQTAAELHMQELMDTDSDNRVIQIIKKLCSDDKDHAKRIASLMKEQGIPEKA